MTRRSLTAVAILVLLPAPMLHADADAKGDKDLKGDWELQSSVEEGVKQTQFSSIVHRLSFREESLTLRTFWGGEVVIELTRKLAIDAAKKPKRIDFLPDADECNPQTVKAIYEVQGDELRLCAAKPGKDRPTELSSKKGSGWTLWTLKRLPKN